MDNFDEYIKKYKELSLKDKQKIIIDELKVLSSFTNKMCNEIGAKNDLLLNKEQSDLNNDNYTEDDFSEAVIVYISSIKDSLCVFSDKLTDISSKL